MLESEGHGMHPLASCGHPTPANTHPFPHFSSPLQSCWAHRKTQTTNKQKPALALSEGPRFRSWEVVVMYRDWTWDRPEGSVVCSLLCTHHESPPTWTNEGH